MVLGGPSWVLCPWMPGSFPIAGRSPCLQGTSLESGSGAGGKQDMRRHTCYQGGTRKRDQMRRMRDGGPHAGIMPGGDGDTQERFPTGSKTIPADNTAGTSGGEPPLPVAVPEVGPNDGPWEMGISTQDRQSPQLSSLRSTPDLWGISPTGRQGPSLQRPFWAYSMATCPCCPTHRTMSPPGNAAAHRETVINNPVHFVHSRIMNNPFPRAAKPPPAVSLFSLCHNSAHRHTLFPFGMRCSGQSQASLAEFPGAKKCPAKSFRLTGNDICAKKQ